MSITALRDYQACCSTHIIIKNLCSETAGMFVANISVKVASTFVVVELSQQVYL